MHKHSLSLSLSLSHTHTHTHTSQSTLDDMDMEDDMKTLVSDEIKKFRLSYEVGVVFIPMNIVNSVTPLHKNLESKHVLT